MSRDSRRPAVANTAVTVEVALFVTRPSKCGIAVLGAGIGLGHGIRAVVVPVITVVAVFQTLFFALRRYLRGISVNNKFTCKT